MKLYLTVIFLCLGLEHQLVVAEASPSPAKAPPLLSNKPLLPEAPPSPAEIPPLLPKKPAVAEHALNSTSLSEKYNKGLSFYQQGRVGLAKAYWRAVLFQKPYNGTVRSALKAVEDKKYFWLWVPEDFALALIAFGFFVLCLSMWRFPHGVALYGPDKKTKVANRFQNTVRLFIKKKLMSLVFCFMCFVLGAIYFYFRLGDYHTLTENSVLLSAPDNHAPVLFEWVEGELLKQWDSKKVDKEVWSHVRSPSGQTGWLKSHKLMPVH